MELFGSTRRASADFGTRAAEGPGVLLRWTAPDQMTGDDRLTLGSSIVFLALAGLSAVRARREPLAFSLGALYLDLFAYNLLDLIGNNAKGEGPPRWLNAATSGLAVPLAFGVVVTFVGQRRQHRPVLLGLYAYFGVLALACVAPFVFPSFAWFPLGEIWAWLVAAGLSVGLAYAMVLLVRHLRACTQDERPSAALVLASFVFGVGGSGTDVFAIAGAPVPKLAAWGLLASGALLAAGTLRFQLVHGLTLRTMLTSIVIALTGIVAQLAVVRYWSASGGLVVLSSLVVTLAVWGALRHVSGLYAERAARLRYHATLGRLAAQMAHDVRNPLAAVRGSAEFLLEERARGRSLDEHVMYLELILEQTDRIGRVVEDYQRLGRAEAKCACLDLGDTLRDVVAAQRMALGEGVDLKLEVVGGPCTVMADAGLVVGAVENLLRNAHEAMPKGGKIAVVIERKGSLAVVRVVDTGQGMDASTRDAALDDFFTTKAKGSGLGLSFVRRVAEAHGTSVRVTSAVGKGTTVELGFPLVEEDAVPSLREADSEVV